jgi:hypothetical protein
MPLQTSGAISLSQVQAEFGGANPVSMSEYYRGGSYVPSTRATSSTVREPSSGTVNGDSSPLAAVWNTSSANGGVLIAWPSGTTIVQGATPGITSYTSGGSTYYRGSFHDSDQYAGTFYNLHRVRTVASTTNINTSIPASGTISMNQFYGGTNT